tara:strand:+ start:150 stop:398 length:249 start_codon:yes stop_codon:yes gene_type:complete
MYDFERGDIVYIRDFPFGKPTRVNGKVVGVLHGEYYNVLLTNGLNEGMIISYKSYQLMKEKDVSREIRESKKRQQSNNKTLQ